MSPRLRWRSSFPWLLLSLLPLAGCVERTAKIQTQPPGALVIINDEEVGVSPVRFSFVWYGDYDIMLRKTGYQTLKTHYKLDAPWYQYPPFDLIAETLLPVTIRDDRELPVFALEPEEGPATTDIVQRAADTRDQATFEGD